MILFARILLLTAIFGLSVAESSAQTFLEAEDAVIGPDATVVKQNSFPSGRGAARLDSWRSEDLEQGLVGAPDEKESNSAADPDSPPDLTFDVSVESPGRYRLQSFAAVDSAGREKMETAVNKKESFFLLISVDGSIPSPRVVVSPWKNLDYCKETLGNFTFTSKTAKIRIWLPIGVRLDGLGLNPVKPVSVPEKAALYRPTILPPAAHPRLWVTPDNIDSVRRNLTRGENADVWEKVKKNAAAEFRFEFDPAQTVDHNARLLTAVKNRAFVFLMDGDEAMGREAIELAVAYLSRVEYGNLLDITRQIGESIYTGALVFDWCNTLLTEEEKTFLTTHLFRLAREMEIGWPPFGQSIVNGHGSEGQLNRDLLAMSIALYERDSLPYQYCAYRVLEELVPMRAFEYQSPRHNQGASYFLFRFSWELHAALLFRRMTNREVFDPNIKTLRDYFLFTSLPDGNRLRDGDGLGKGNGSKESPVLLTLASYGKDPVIKADYFRRGPIIADPVLFLLLNDPELTPDFTFDTLPLVLETGPILSSQIIRTGWDFGPESDDMVIEFKGGCYNFGNHQHADAGAFQIWYRGWLAADLGQYHFYGTPYDMNFAKRSVAHSMPLVFDPDEEVVDGHAPDGGERFICSTPKTPDEVQTDPLFRTGTVLESTVVPSKESPDYSVFSVDLTPAWSDKVIEHRRSFCWIRTGKPENPAVVIVFDKITARNENLKKYWQLNSLTPPTLLSDGGFEILTLPRPSDVSGAEQPRLSGDGKKENALLKTSAAGLASSKSVSTETVSSEAVASEPSSRPRGKLTVQPLIPRPEEIMLETLGGSEALQVFGQCYTAPDPTPEANGWRTLCSPKRSAKTDFFLFLLNIGDENAEVPPFCFEEITDAWQIDVAGKTVMISQDGSVSVTE